MKKIIHNVKNDKRLSALLIILLTAAYLISTAAFAQEAAVTSSATNIEYTADSLSYGDLWAFPNTVYLNSNYALLNSENSKELYSSNKADTSTTGTFTYYTYYGMVNIVSHAGVHEDSVPLDSYIYQDFSYSQVGTSIEGTGNHTIPTRTAITDKQYGSYAVVPDSTGTYRVYVYYEGDTAPSSLVKYHLFDSYASYNAYTAGFNGESMTADGSLAFQRAADGSNWWYAEFKIEAIGWTGYKIDAAKSSSAASTETADKGAGEYTGTQSSAESISAQLDNSSYYYNEWTVTEIKFDTLLVMQWDSSVQLGPITKTDTITISSGGDDTYNGTVAVVNVFGETVAVDTKTTTAHAPLFFTGTANAGSVYDGIADIELDRGAYYFEGSDVTLTATWAEYIPYPTFKLYSSFDGGESYTYVGTSDFYASSVYNANFIFGESVKYKIEADFSETDIEKVAYSYSVTGITTEGTLTADKNTIEIDVKTEDVAILFAIDNVTRTSTIKLNAATVGAIYVAENITTGERYFFIEDAIAAANADETIVLLADTAFRTAQEGRKWAWTNGNAGYTIDKNVTLVLPYAKGCNDTDSENVFPYANYVCNRTTSVLDPLIGVYLTLTVPADVEITNYGLIAVGGQVTGATKQGYAGVTAASHSNMVLDGSLKMCDNSILAVTGYILGDGTVDTAGSKGVKIYQLFSVLDFMGGGYTILAAGNYDGTLVSAKAVPTLSGEDYITPFNRYAMLGIQTNLIIHKGNYLYGYCDLYAGSQDNQTTGVLIGDATIPGILNLTEDDSSVTASYDGNTYVDNYSAGGQTLHLSKVGKTTLTITGGAALGSMELALKVSVIDASVDTAGVTFPLPYNYDIVLLNGEYAIEYDFSLLPGASLTVGHEATLTVGSTTATQFTVYDGLFDHRDYDDETFNPISYHTVSQYTYPNTQRLQAQCFGGNGTANLIVDGGTLKLGANVTFGGLVQTTGSGSLAVESGAKLESTVQYGVTGSETYGIPGMASYSCYAAGATVSAVDGRVIDPHTGKQVPLTTGVTYSACQLTGYTDTFRYTLYADCDDTTVCADYTDTLNARVQGAWYCYTASITDGTSSTAAYFAHGADVSNYFADADCETAATTVTADKQTYYYATPVARVDWADGSESTYYVTLQAAVDAAIHSGDSVVLCRSVTWTNTVEIKSGQSITMDLNDFDISSTVQAIFNNGALTLNLNGGSISVAGTAMEVVYNAPGATMVITGGMGADGVQGAISSSAVGTATIVSGNSGQNIFYAATVRNQGTLTLTDVTINQTGDSTNNVALVNFDTGVIIAMSGVTINNAEATNKGYAIYNLGATIEKIESCNIYGYYGIYNRNISTVLTTMSAGGNTNTTRSVQSADIAYIGTIANSIIAVTYRYGIHNYGLISNITGTTSISAANRYAIFNQYAWYYDSAIYRAYYEDVNGDGREDRIYLYDEANRPTIESISGSVTLSTANYCIWNGGFIHSIDGDAISITATSNYGILNFWQIGEIKGKVTFNASSYAIYNGINSEDNYAYAYTRQEYCRIYGSDGVEYQRIYNYTFGDSKIGTIGGTADDVIKINVTGRSGAIVNKGDIDLIGRGTTITVTYASNLTSSQVLYGILNSDTRYCGYTNEITLVGGEDDALTYDEVSYKYANQLVITYRYKPSTIKAIDGSASKGVQITMKFTYANTETTYRSVYAIYNAGIIQALKYTTITGSSYTVNSSSKIYNRPQNLLYNCSSGPLIGEASKIAYYYADTKFSFDTDVETTVAVVEPTWVGTIDRDISTIGEIANCTVSGYRYGVLNAGHIGTIKNSTIKMSSTYAIKMDTRSVNKKVYSHTPAEYAEAADITTNTFPSVTSVTYYAQSVLDLIGEGNTIQATGNTIRNMGLIKVIDGGGTTVIKSTSSTAGDTSGAIVNVGCFTLHNEDGVTYNQGAEIGTISDVTITAVGYPAILNYAATDAEGYTSRIGELKDGILAYSSGNYAVYANNAYGETEITLISGGDYLGKSSSTGAREDSIYLPDEQVYGVMLHGVLFDEYTLSSETRTATSADGNSYECYYIVPTHTHSFDNGICTACGMFQFYGANVTMGNNLDMMFAFPQAGADDWGGYYVVAVRTYSLDKNGNIKQTVTEKYAFDDAQWTVNGNYYVVTYDGFAAKEMCDTITLIVCNSSGIAVSEPWVDSMQDYAMRMLSKAEANDLQNMKILIVDMLNYGAAAQNYFGYGTDAPLANSELSDEQQNSGSLNEDIANVLDQGDAWLGSNLTLESNIAFKIAFTGLTEDMCAKIEYTNHWEKTIETVINVTVDGSSMFFVVPKVVVADARCDIKVTVYTDSTQATVFTTCSDSIEAYAARLSSGSDEAQKGIVTAFMIFADSAHTYLHDRNT